MKTPEGFRPAPGEYYKVQDLENAGIAKRVTICRWIKTGRLRASKIGKGYIISGGDLISFIADAQSPVKR